jgi:hypothetical protein
MSIYTDNGYKDRIDYLKSLAEDYGVSLDKVFAVAAVLGPNEDFDGLVVAIQDESDRESLQEALFSNVYESEDGLHGVASLFKHSEKFP